MYSLWDHTVSQKYSNETWQLSPRNIICSIHQQKQTSNKSKLCSVMSSIIFLHVFGVSKASCPVSLFYNESKKSTTSLQMYQRKAFSCKILRCLSFTVTKCGTSISMSDFLSVRKLSSQNQYISCLMFMDAVTRTVACCLDDSVVVFCIPTDIHIMLTWKPGAKVSS